MVVVVAEKPSVARDIARVLGARERSDGAIRGAGYVITWAIGHLVALAQPDEMEPSWKSWRFESLPMLPQRWSLSVIEQTRSQFEVVRQLRQAGRYVPVLMLTARGRPEDVVNGFEAGADDYLAKPFELSVLIARVGALLRRHAWGQRGHA